MEAIIPDIPNIKAHWEHHGVDPVPYLMVPMSNGTVLRYQAVAEHPALTRIRQNMRNLSVMSNGCQMPDDMIPGQITMDDIFFERGEKDNGRND